MVAWVHAGMLAGLAALAIPVLIHLLRSRRFEPADLGTVRFLRQAVHETTRWRRIRDVLLLALRLVAVALLVGLFARPYRAGAGGQRDRDAAVVVLLDASGSTAGRVLGRPVWETVRDTGRSVLAALPESARVTVGVFADTVVEADPLPAQPALGAGTDYAGALRWAADRLQASRARAREIVLVTDLQRSGLPQRPLTDWPAGIGVRIREVPAPGAHNLAIAGVECLTPFPGDEARFAVRVVCSGEPPPGAVEVTFQVEGREPERRSLEMGSQEAVFVVRPAPAGVCRGTARVASADAWPDDDALEFCVGLRQPLRLVIVDGHPAAEVQESGAYFLATALAGARDGEGRAAYALEVRGEAGGWDDAAAVFLCDAPALAEAPRKALAEAVRRGTGLALFLGENATETAAGSLREAGLLPARVTRNRVPVPEPLSDWDAAHPVLRPFGAPEGGALRRIVFRDAFRVEPDAGTAVLARLAGGQPAILAGGLGEGRLVVVTNPSSRAWTDWPTERLFLPLVREVAAYVTRLRERGAGVLCRAASVAEPGAPGILPGEPPTWVTPDPREAAIERCPQTDFRAALGVGPPPADDGVEESVLPAGRERRQEWWPWLALGLAMVLVVEGLVSDWPRRVRAAPPAATA